MIITTTCIALPLNQGYLPVGPEHVRLVHLGVTVIFHFPTSTALRHHRGSKSNDERKRAPNEKSG